MKSIRPRLLFVGGTTASVLFNFAIAATLLRREAELAEFYWLASFLLAGAVSLLASLPIFGGMTFISWRVRKKTTLREATRCKRNFLTGCIVTTLLAATSAIQCRILPSKFSVLQLLFSIEIGLIGFVLSLALISSIRRSKPASDSTSQELQSSVDDSP